jgi:hypothetical protein
MALHDSDERRQVITDALSSRAAAESNRSKSGPTGTTAGKGAVSIAGRLGNMCFELRFCRARPAGFEPATRCLEGSCSVRLSYGRPEIILHGECHAPAT